jgi:hypothetical protein
MTDDGKKQFDLPSDHASLTLQKTADRPPSIKKNDHNIDHGARSERVLVDVQRLIG